MFTVDRTIHNIIYNDAIKCDDWNNPILHTMDKSYNRLPFLSTHIFMRPYAHFLQLHQQTSACMHQKLPWQCGSCTLPIVIHFICRHWWKWPCSWCQAAGGHGRVLEDLCEHHVWAAAHPTVYQDKEIYSNLREWKKMQDQLDWENKGSPPHMSNCEDTRWYWQNTTNSRQDSSPLELPCRFPTYSRVVDINSGCSFFLYSMTLLLGNVPYTFVTILCVDPSSDTYWGTSCAFTHTI